MNEKYRFYDVFAKEFYNPWTGKPVFGDVHPRLDWERVRVAVTYGRVKVPRNAIPIPSTAAYEYNLSTYTSAVFALKTDTNYKLTDTDAAAATLAFSAAGFDTSDTAWHHLSGHVGLITLAPIVIPLTVISGPYREEVALLKTNVRTTLYPNLTQPFQGSVLIDVYTGSESNAPSGTPGSVSGTWTISGATNYVDVTVTGATSGTFLAIGVTGSTGRPGDPGTLIGTPLVGGANTVRISTLSGLAPGAGATWTGNWSLLVL